MKSRKGLITAIILLIALMIIITILFIFLLNGSKNGLNFMFGYNVSRNLVIDDTYESNKTHINIDSQMGDVYLKESSDEKIRVVVYGNKEDIEITNNTNELNIITNTKKCNFICFNETGSKIELYIPKNYSENIDIKSAYGDIDIAEFNDANITINADCGDIKIKSVGNLKLNNAYGDIELEFASKADIAADCGDIKIGTVFDLKAENSLGDIEIESIKGNFDIESNCGDVEIDRLSIDKNSSIKNDLGDIKIGDTNQIFIDANTDLGKVKIKNNYNKSDITLTLENDCGDITVNNKQTIN